MLQIPAPRAAWGGRVFALLSFGALLLPLQAHSQDKPAGKRAEAWPTAVHARYSLSYNGIGVGKLNIKSSIEANNYTLTGSAKVSVLFGAFKWSGSSSVSGTIDGGAPAPAAYAFEWRQNKKGGTVNMGFTDRLATEIAVNPPPRPKRDVVPLMEAHKVGALDPMSAVLMLTKADSRPPCDRRVGIFDGKHRYDVVFTPKRTTRLPAASGNGPAETAYVCRIMYEPVAGHRDNEDTKAYAANRDAEVTLRRVPGSQMLIPYSVTIPTAWGTGTMVAEKIEVVTAGAGKIAFTN